jgi:hypothetical protein
MLARPVWSQILHDEALTRHLGDPEARVLVEWLVEQAEQIDGPEGAQAETVRLLCRRGRAISRFVRLWCYDCARGAAIQLAGSERFGWPLPDRAVDPCDLMHAILAWESEHRAAVP